MRPPIRCVSVALLAAIVATGTTGAQGTAATAAEGDFVLRDFAFDAGERLPELRIHYQTLGVPHRGPAGRVDNAVLVLHGTGGTGRQFLTPNFAGVLFGPGQLLDAARYFVVMPDGIGHGGSSKPSNGMHARFPRYGYRDMIRAQHRLLTEGLQVDHLRLVIGTSMGGMHTWLWGETYPGFMDALMPLASLPTQIAGRNRMMRRTAMDSIRNDPEWKGGEYEAQPRAGLTAAVYTLLFMGSSPLQWQKAAPTRDAADRYFDEQVQARVKTMDATDTLYQFDASRDYDPEPALEAIRAPLVAINSADDEVNPPELGILERLIRRVPRGRAVLLPISAETRGHGTHSWPALWQDHLAALLRESDPQAPSSPAP
jgi:homoserine O-acetyltransferase